MTMNQLEVLLSAWGRWAVAGESQALGYASICPMFRDAKPSRVYESSPPAGYSARDFEAVTEAVRALPLFHGVALVAFYQIGGCVLDVAAKRMGVDSRVAGRYVKEARFLLCAHFT